MSSRNAHRRQAERREHTSAGNGRLTPKEFILQGIERLRSEPGKGIHVVYSGFNEAFRAYFPGMDPVSTMQGLAKEGVIRIFPCKGGVVINTPRKRDEHRPNWMGRKALEKMGLAE